MLIINSGVKFSLYYNNDYCYNFSCTDVTKSFEEAKKKETELENKLQGLQEESSKMEAQSLGQQPIAFLYKSF